MTQKESPESRLFRPCKCSGSVSYVHISCLNQWRATSTDAFYQCSICKYRYQIERTFLAEFLMKENSIVILCIVMILVAVILSGALLNQSVKYLGSNNIVLADIILQHLEVQPIWKSPVCQQFSINTIIHNIYVMYKHDYNLMVKAYIQLVFYTSVLWFWLACLPLFARVIDILLIGTAVVACLGFSLYVYHELLLLRFGDQRMMMHVGMVAGWFASLGNRAFARMTLLIGCVIAFRQVYNSMQVAARQFSSWLGDRILEPHDLQ